MTNGSPAQSFLELLMQVVRDRRSGNVRALEDYQKQSPLLAGELAAHWHDLGGDTPHVGAHRIGKYRIEGELGSGGQGVVYRAVDETLGRTVALKVLRVAAVAGAATAERFRREAEVASRLEHPAIATVYETGSADGIEWIAMRFVPGKTLAERIAEAPGQEDPKAPAFCAPAGDPRESGAMERLLEFLEEAARAVHFAHEHGIVHRDLKPGNVMVGSDARPVILDFGLARDCSGATPTVTGSEQVFGTPAYMSPEQIRGSHAVDRRTDVWALGAVLYEALTLRQPFAAASAQGVLRAVLEAEPLPPRRRNPAVSPDLECVVLTALEKDPQRRYRTALELADELCRVREGGEILARPAGTFRRLRRVCARHPLAALALAAAVAILALAASLALTWREREFLRRMADVERVAELLEEERERLWPVGPDLVPRCDAWLAAAKECSDRRGVHEEVLEDLQREARRGRAGTDPALRLLSDKLTAHLRGLDRLSERVSAVVSRRERSRTLAERSIDQRALDWERCIAAIAAAPAYAGLRIAPQLGLVPLGQNAQGLFEFWVMESGERPAFADDRGALPADDAGIALVLLPGGTAFLGASVAEEPNLDPFAQQNEQPVRELRLAPFFAAKYEFTQGQYARLYEGANPAHLQPGYDLVDGYRVEDLSHPLESATWRELRSAFFRIGLELPTEAQWEYACRAGTGTPWSFGSATEWARCAEFANFRGAEVTARFTDAPQVAGYEDAWIRHAPVGRFLPNGFGLHDMHGNVWEMTRDPYVAPYPEPRAGDGLLDSAPDPLRCAIRGGSAEVPVGTGRSAIRSPYGTTERAWSIGARPVRALTPASP